MLSVMGLAQNYLISKQPSVSYADYMINLHTDYQYHYQHRAYSNMTSSKQENMIGDNHQS